VSPDRFERQLWTLRRLGLRGVSMGEGMTRLRNGSTRGCVVLTFDDGYTDTLTAAAPLMKRYGYRATCYVVSNALGTYNRWDAEFLQERKPLMSREQLVRRAGYSSAVTVVRGVARASDERLRLPRILVNGERGLWNFLLHVATPYQRLRRHRRAP